MKSKVKGTTVMFKLLSFLKSKVKMTTVMFKLLNGFADSDP